MTHRLAGTGDPFAEPELTGLGRLGARGSFLSYSRGADAAGGTGSRVLEVGDGRRFRYFEDLDDARGRRAGALVGPPGDPERKVRSAIPPGRSRRRRLGARASRRG